MANICVPHPPKAKCVATVNPHVSIFVTTVTTGRLYPRGNQSRAGR